MRFDPGSRSPLTRRDLGRFAGSTLFDRVGRAVCEAESLPRRELYEAWEVVRRARRRMRGGRVVDLACGHALAAHLALVLDASSESALAADVRLPASAAPVSAAMVAAWPRLAGRVAIEARAIDDVALAEGDLVISIHACGALTDRVIARAIGARARLALLPCCHDEAACDPGGLGGWLDAALAIDVTRAALLRASGYAVHTQTIPSAITAKNRLLLAWPARSPQTGGHE